MIQRIKIRFITLAMTALLILLALIITSMNLMNYHAVISGADEKLELLSQNKGNFPEFGTDKKWPIPANMTMETPYETRYFSVLLATNGDIIETNTAKIKAVDASAAADYAQKVVERNTSSGFVGNYRYSMSAEGAAIRVTFLDCSRELSSFHDYLAISISIALLGCLAFFIILLFFSGRIIKPVTDSYNKQRQFITNAGHELKTPLAIIKADVDVLEMDYGENEWLSGIQSQVKRMADLTNDLVYLSRMEETEPDLQMIDFPFSDVVVETAQAFQAIAQTQKKTFRCQAVPMLSFVGNERAIRQLVNILMDNAMKYSPPNGSVSLTVGKHNRNIYLSVYNTTIDPVEKKNLSRIFERFYRMDSSRSSQTGGYGIGLSVAKAIVSAHNGKIYAFSPDGHSLQVNVLFPT